MILYLFLICALANSFPISRIKLGERIVIVDSDDIKKPLEDLGKDREGIDMRFPNITESNYNELITINENFKKMKILKTLEDDKCPLNYKLRLLEENNDLINLFNTDAKGNDLLAGGLKEDLDDFLEGI